MAHAAHRPDRVESGRRWAMAMRWVDLLFMHWRLPRADVQALLPAGLVVDTFAGSAWLGVIPFEMQRVRPRGLPPLPGLSRFGELNVRTYASLADDPAVSGVWFFSLDASNAIAVAAARRAFHLNYQRADMAIERVGDGSIRYRSRRTHPGGGAAEFDATYRPLGGGETLFESHTDDLADFLTSRYRLFADTPRGLAVGEIDHGPWRLRPAACELRTNTMAAPLGLRLPGVDEAVLHVAEPLDVRAWALRGAQRDE